MEVYSFLFPALVFFAWCFFMVVCIGPLLQTWLWSVAAITKKPLRIRFALHTSNFVRHNTMLALVILFSLILYGCTSASDTTADDFRLMLMYTGSAYGVLLIAFGIYQFGLQHYKKSAYIPAVTSLLLTLCLWAGIIVCISFPFLVASSQFLSIQDFFRGIPTIASFVIALLGGKVFLVQILASGIAVTAFCCIFWLMRRRDKDDYGRDYYNFSVKRCSLIALAGTAGESLIALLNWYTVTMLSVDAETTAQTGVNFWINLLPVGAGLLSCALLAAVIASKTPLRYKIALYAAFFLMLTNTFGHFLFMSLGYLLFSQ